MKSKNPFTFIVTQESVTCALLAWLKPGFLKLARLALHGSSYSSPGTSRAVILLYVTGP